MTYAVPAHALVGPISARLSLPDAECFDSVDRLVADSRRFDIVLLNLPGAVAGESLGQLRWHSNYAFTLAYCCQDQDAVCAALGDGPLPQDLGLLDWQTWQSRFAQLDPVRIQERIESRVLVWMWLRQSRQIRAVRSPRLATHYDYPVVTALAGTEAGHAFALVQSMVREGYIAEQQLIDRLRLCVGCDSGWLNYIDVCPECQSIAIGREPSLHCFICGHVSTQERFLKDNVLACPNCQTRLRHIGSDYDRPMENYRCRGCRAFFIDAKVQARCLDCGHMHAPEELRVQEVRDYRLTEAGRLHCRQGERGSLLTNPGFGALGLISLDTFHYLLNWLIQMQNRYRQPGFSLLGVRFMNFPQALAKMGELRASQMVDNIVQRITSGLRSTDRCARTNDECLWVLLPHTHAEGLDTVRQRILKLKELFAAGADEIELRVVSASAPQDLLDRENAELLMTRLAGGLE